MLPKEREMHWDFSVMDCLSICVSREIISDFDSLPSRGDEIFLPVHRNAKQFMQNSDKDPSLHKATSD